MTTFNTNSNNDIFLNTAGRIDISSDQYAILKVCENAIKTMKGELVLQGNEGMPNFQTIWSGSPNIPQYENAIRQTLLGVNGVHEIKDIDVFVENNILKYNVTIKTIYGEESLNGL